MNLTLIACVAMGVFTTFLGFTMLMTHVRGPALPPPPLEQNFRSRESVVVDQTTGERTIYREITVSTKLAEPER